MFRSTTTQLPILSTLADRVWTDARARHSFFLLAALASIVISGYHFGTFDQFAHIPFLKYYADPTLFPRDEFVQQMSRQNYSYFWRLFVPVYQLDLAYGQQMPETIQPLFLGSAMLMTHIAATYATFWMFWEISLELFDDLPTAFFSVLAFIIPHLGFGGFMVLEFSLLNRTFALPFLLWAIVLYLRRHYGLAFLVVGAMYNIHVISVNFVLAMLLFDAARRWRAVGLKTIAVGVSLFVLGAAPVLWWRLTASAIILQPDLEWFSVMTRGTLYNLFFMVAPYFHINFITLFGLSALLMFGIGHRFAPARRHAASLLNFMIAVAVILAAQVVTTHFFPITIIVQLQIIRVGVFALSFGYLYFVHYLLVRQRAGNLGWWDFCLLMAATIVSPTPLFPAALWAMQQWIRLARARLVAMLAAVGLSILLGAWLLSTFNLWAPGLHPFGPRNAWYEAQRWARAHTPRDAVFITPPDKWWLYESDWRVFSERSTIVSHIELIMIAIAPSYFPEWRERFEQVAPGAIEQFDGDYFENVDIIRQAYNTLTLNDLRRISQRYGADYLVVEKPNRRELAIAYENEQFIIYKLR
ncbi:MAG: DUF6798 domain-containing protein [Anaerolineales bacterium]